MTSREDQIVKEHQKAAPIDITALATNLGLSVYEDYDLPAGISGRIKKESEEGASSGFSISVNAEEPYKRRRFTIAHECAHYLLHRSKIGTELDDNVMYRSQSLDNRDEFDANNLAAELLMPRHLIQQSLDSGFRTVSMLSLLFEVSEASMRVRLNYLYQK